MLKNQDFKKVLIAPLYGLGDSILTTPALKKLKGYYPDIELTFFTFNKAVYEIFKTCPYLEKVLFYPLLEKDKFYAFFYIFKNFAFKFDAVINFYPSNRKDYNFFSLLTFAKKRIGHTYNFANLIEFNWLKNYTIQENYSLHCVEENIKLLEFFNIKVKKNEIPELEIFLHSDEIKNGEKFLSSFKGIKKIGIHTGSSSFKNHKCKRWPKEYFLEVINNFKNFHFFLFGTNEESEENDFIIKNSKFENVYLIRNKNIREVAAIIKNLDFFISNDSGLMHLSAAVETKTMGVFGPTNPVWVKPWGKNHIVVKSNLKCSPCFIYSPKPLYCFNRVKWECLKNIKPGKIIQIIEKYL